MRLSEILASGGGCKGNKIGGIFRTMDFVFGILVFTFFLCVLIVIIGRLSANANNEASKPETKEISFTVNGKETKIETPLSDAFFRNMEAKKRNRENPLSCEREPNADEVRVSINFFDPCCGLAGWDKYDIYWKARTSAIFKGYNNIIVKAEDYAEAKDYITQSKKLKENLYATAALNNAGREHEQNGEIDAAISTYEECVALGYRACYAYERLMILYRKKKDYTNEKRIIETALKLYPDNEKYKLRLSKVLKKTGNV